MTDVKKVGEYVKARATHHNHGDGWKYSRNIKDLELIRFKHDYTGYNHWTKRVRRAFDPKHLLGIDSISKQLKFRRHGFLSALAWIKVSLQKDDNLPDGMIGGNITFWEEDGEYIECVGPTIGERIADFLIEEPDNPHAIRIAEEIERIVWRDRSGESVD
jgi:hypothetical protein